VDQANESKIRSSHLSKAPEKRNIGRKKDPENCGAIRK